MKKAEQRNMKGSAWNVAEQCFTTEDGERWKYTSKGEDERGRPILQVTWLVEDAHPPSPATQGEGTDR